MASTNDPGLDKKRTITIDPSMYSITKKSRRTARNGNNNNNNNNNNNASLKSLKPRPFIRPNLLKKTLIAKIKLHQQQKQQQHRTENNETSEIAAASATTANAVHPDASATFPENTTSTAFSNSFNDSLSYLQSLSDNKQSDKRRDKIKSRSAASQPTETSPLPPKDHEQVSTTAAAPEVHIDPPSSSTFNFNFDNAPNQDQTTIQLNNEPVWGCLKNGGKPTFRMVNNNTTLKNTSAPSASVIESESESEIEVRNATNAAIETMYGGRKQRLDEYKRDHIQNMIKNQEPIIKIRETKQHVITKKYKLGKYVNKNGPVIGVLIKNRQTQYNVEKKRNEMKHIPLHTIKARLHKKNLLKVGSIAPPDVLRELYETAVFAGDIEYENEGTLLHNFLTSTESSSPENDSGSS